MSVVRQDRLLISNPDGEVWINYYADKNWWVVHSSINSWGHRKYREYLKLFGETLVQLREEGITELYAIPPTEFDKKWEQLFGFKQIGWLNDYPLMRIQYGN